MKNGKRDLNSTKIIAYPNAPQRTPLPMRCKFNHDPTKGPVTCFNEYHTMNTTQHTHNGNPCNDCDHIEPSEKIIPATQHTQTPYEAHWHPEKNKWIVGDKGKFDSIAIVRDEANARFIVTACNNHDRLVEALRKEHEAYFRNVQNLTHEKERCGVCTLLAEIEG